MTRICALSRLFCLTTIVSAGLVANVSAEEPAADSPPTLDVILKRGTESLFSLSPDGSKVSFMRWTPSGYYFVIHNTENGEWVNELPFGRSRPTRVRWLTNTRIIYERSWSVYLMNVDGTDHKPLLTRFDSDRSSNYRRAFRNWQVLHLLPDDPEHILAQSWNKDGDPAVVKVNLYTGEEDVLVYDRKLNVEYWSVDRDGDVRIGTRYKKDELQILMRDQDSGKWQVYDDYELEGKNTLGHTGKTYLSKRISIETFDYDNNRIFMADNRDRDRFRIVKYDLPSRSIVEEVLADERYDVGGPEQDTSMYFDDATQAMVGIRYLQDKSTTVWFDEQLKAFQAEIDSRRPDHINELIDWTDDRKTFVVHSYNDTDPGRYSIVHPGSPYLYTFAISNEKLESKSLAPTDVVAISARDDYPLDAYLTKARSDEDSPKKLVLMPHGGPFARDVWGYDPWAQFFATRGMSVLQVNFRGSTGYGRKHVLDGLQNLDSLMIDDVADAATWAIENEVAAADQVFIFGHSYGGYAALMSGLRYPDLYQAAVSWSAPLDLLKQLNHFKKEEHYFAYEYWKTVAGDPKNEKGTLKRMSPIHNVEDIAVPFLVFHGETDATVPKETAEDFETALEKAGMDNEVVILDDEGHSFRNNDNISYLLEKSLRFFEKHGGP